MTILETLVSLRDDIKLWCINNFSALRQSLTGLQTKLDSEKVVVSNSATETSNATSSGSVYLNHIGEDGVKSSNKISGSGSTTISSDAKGNITISSTGGSDVSVSSSLSSGTHIGTITANGVATKLYAPTAGESVTYDVATSSNLGLIKSGGDITVDDSGIVSVNDDSHNHVISNIDNLQDKLDGKQATITGGASTITTHNLTASRALVSNASGKVTPSDITSTELSYLDGVTSNIQTQLNSKMKNLTLTWDSVDGDTTANWKALGTGWVYVSAGGAVTTPQHNGVDETYAGIVINYVSNSLIRQEWHALTTKNRVFVRGGNASGWYGGGTWSELAQASEKQDTITGAASTVASDNLTASRALVANSSGKIDVSAVTANELSYLSGVTTNIQVELDKIDGKMGAYLGKNPVAEDTTTAWKTLGSGYVYIDNTDEVITRPVRNGTASSYGLVVNYVSSSGLITQTWYTLASSRRVYTRSGNASGWYGGGTGEWNELAQASELVGRFSTSTNAEIFNDYSTNVASGTYSHAEGYNTTASGSYSHAEGYMTTASESSAHAEGNSTTASGLYSHAEGSGTIASGNYSHAEGSSTKATSSTTEVASVTSTTTAGYYTHAEGYGSVASGAVSHAEGNGTKASGAYSHAEGRSTVASGAYSHAEGNGTKAIGIGSHAEGYITKVTNDSAVEVSTTANTDDGNYAHAEGYGTVARGTASHAEGNGCLADGLYAHAEGYGTAATDDLYAYPRSDISLSASTGACTHAEGFCTVANGKCAHAEGYQTNASGYYSHAEGYMTTAYGNNTHAAGTGTYAKGNSQYVVGRYNSTNYGASTLNDSDDSGLFIVGNGIKSTDLSNAFRVATTGKVYAGSTYHTNSADYAEYFEWLDGNPKDEDRRGYFVTFKDDKIRYATVDDSYILGIVSSDPSVVGDSQSDEWRNKYLRDIFGRKIYETIEVEETIDENGAIIPAHIEKHWKINPDYNAEEEYTSRANRPEWDVVGLVGKLVAVDDGTCQVNGYCYPGVDGIATASEKQTAYRVIARLDENHIKVFIK